jgi:hypothetical protein
MHLADDVAFYWISFLGGKEEDEVVSMMEKCL